MRKQTLEFGPFEFDVARSLLFRDNAPIALGQRGAALLAALLRRRGEVLTKAELIDSAWPGVIVEEANLSVQISLLRQALGRTANGGEWIVTAQRIGYRFIPAIEARAVSQPAPALAILPFTDFNTGVQSEADGLVEDLTTALSRFKSISVVARNTSFHAHGREGDVRRLARQLGAGYVLEGSLRRAGARLVTNVQLIDGMTGSHLWAETFERLAEAGDLESHLAQRIAAKVEPAIYAVETSRSRAERPESESVRDLYLRARWLLRRSEEPGNAAAHRLVQRALRLEPENIHLLALGAEVLHHRISVGWPAIGPDDMQTMTDIALRGMSLGIDDGAALGLFSNAMFTAHEWDVGIVTTERAVGANASSSMALVCAGMCYGWLGRTEKAAEHFERAAAFGPSDPNLRFSMTGLAMVSRRRGNYEASIDFAKRSLAVGNHSSAHWNLITASVGLGRLADARRYVANFRAISPHTTIASVRQGQPVVDERLLAPVLEALSVAGMPEG